ncbi:MAG TPA: membrane dipeptidase, partial [Gemmatimonadota bacterium]|nr:membrane dipeptidase [Gemmatimonadota bacterium]
MIGTADSARSGMRGVRLIGAVLAMTALGVFWGPSPGVAQDGETALDTSRVGEARALLDRHPVFDGHNDLAWAIRRAEVPLDVEAYDLREPTPGHTDLARLAAGGVGAQFWSVYIPGEIADSGYVRVQLEQIDVARRVIERYPELELVGTADEAEAAMEEGRIASMLGLEGGHALGNSISLLRVYYDLGARYMTLTHNVTLDWADAATDTRRHGGLTGFGEDVVREMNRLGMLVDLSHVSPATMHDALDVTEAPVIFSHSSARALTDHARNVPDDVLARMVDNGGLVMVTIVPSFVSEPLRLWGVRQDSLRDELEAAGASEDDVREAVAAFREANPRPNATIADVADHIEHVRDVAGIDNVGIGADYDGIGSTPIGLDDAATYPMLIAELLRRGWSEADLSKLTNGNAFRVLRAAETVADRL